MRVKSFFDQDTATFTYLIIDSETQKCAVIDPVLNYDPFAGRTSSESIEQVMGFIDAQQLEVVWILETHCHADHLSGAHELQQHVGGMIGIGEHIRDILEYWVPLFGTTRDTPLDGSQFDRLFKDGDILPLGNLEITVIQTPGHTPACVSYLLEDVVFVGDTLFMPDVGTARTDFPGGSAQILYESIEKLLALPEHTRIFTCHDYPPNSRNVQGQSTVAMQKADNIMVHQGISKRDFTKARKVKDQGKAVPRLLLPSIQVNLRAGDLGEAETNQIQYLKIPLNLLGD